MNNPYGYILLIFISAGLPACTNSLYVKTGPQINISKSILEAENIDSIIRPYRNELAEKMNVEVAKSEVNFIVQRPSSNLMNWMADAVFTNQTKNVKLSYPTFCLLNTGGIRSSLGIGKVSLGDLYKLMPFDNSIVWIRLPISTLESIESYIAKSGGEPISNISIVENHIQFNGFDRSQTTEFWVITSDYLYNGGDHMDFFQEGLEIIETNTLIRDAIIEEAKNQVILNNDEKSRIK
ncbi:MAG: hypothetical protein DBW72_01945 [Flavobacteriales bacterium]|nr:MAG: hypothetical protein DBW72_01945 [Flavobacteriales bacterium]